MANILLIEDDISIAKLYTTELNLRGHTVTHVISGLNIVETATKVKPELILLDIQLPDKDGLTLLSELKADATTKAIKVIILSNYSSEENIDKALKIGAEDFIPKHRIVPEELGQKVESYIG